MTVQDIHPNVQGVRRVYESGPPSSSSETMYLVCHPDPSLNKDILLWDDILAVFSNALYVRSGATVLPFAKGPDFKNLDPLRIASVPGVTLDVIVRDQLIEKEVSMDSLQQALLDLPKEDSSACTIPISNAATAAVRRNPIGGLVEEAMQNYTHIDNPATLPPRRGPQTIRTEQTSPDNTIPAISSPNDSVKHPGAPQERPSTGTQDLAETVMNAMLGDKYAQNTLGELYKEGRGVHQDYQAAMDWFLKAADQGLARAQFNIGDLYDYGHGVPKDYSKAMDWFLLAAAQDDLEAQGSIADLYANGQGVPQNYCQAIEWYLKAANRGLARAQNNIGYRYLHGQGVSQDYSQAMDWFLKAANQGYAAAEFFIGLFYHFGYGVPHDYTTAMEWYLKAHKQSHAGARGNIGLLYANGQGVPRDYSKALEWYQRSAGQGDRGAQFSIGYMYERGFGIPEDKAKAMGWYKKAIDQGDATPKIRFDKLKEQGYSPKE